MGKITKIEQSIVDAIKQTGAFFAVKGYQGEFSRADAIKMPSAFVVYEKGEYERRNRITERISRWNIIIATTSAKRQKAKDEMYDLLEVVRNAMENFSACDSCGNFELKEEGLLEVNEMLMVFTQIYQLKERMMS